MVRPCSESPSYPLLDVQSSDKIIFCIYRGATSIVEYTSGLSSPTTTSLDETLDYSLQISNMKSNLFFLAAVPAAFAGILNDRAACNAVRVNVVTLV